MDTTVRNYPNLTRNGQIFPSWILKHFSQYYLPEIVRQDGVDPCDIKSKKELRKYQLFLSEYLSPTSPYRGIIIYHGMGSGKTATAIQLLNVAYQMDSGTNFVVLIKASLKHDPWFIDMKEWLYRTAAERGKEDLEEIEMFSKVHFIHYDSNQAYKDLLEVLKKIDPNEPITFVCDEAHNFFSNVYSNISGSGSRAIKLYQEMLKIKQKYIDTRIILLSATPAMTRPFELALQFNLLRPGIFPEKEEEFNEIFLTKEQYPTLNPLRKNLFQRRILGLVSYYIGATPDLYAKKYTHLMNMTMTPYQYRIYLKAEAEERKKAAAAKARDQEDKLFKIYTRRASNFVFPDLGTRVNGVSRPKRSDYNKPSSKKNPKSVEQIREEDAEYMKQLEMYLSATEKYLFHLKNNQTGRTLEEDLAELKEGFYGTYQKDFRKWYQDGEGKSELVRKMHQLSPKMTAIVMSSYACPGKVGVFSNFKKAEGADCIGIYFRVIGFADYREDETPPYLGYTIFHGGISRKERDEMKDDYNHVDNTKGRNCKVFIFTPSGAEGIQVLAARQAHLLEPGWGDVRTSQVIGRFLRQCGHKHLPLHQRKLDVYIYYATRPEEAVKKEIATDEYIDRIAKNKSMLLNSFLQAIKEAAIDCELFSNHNFLEGAYSCFQFPEGNVLGDKSRPAYLPNIEEDMSFDVGSNASNTRTVAARVYKMKVILPQETEIVEGWHDPKTDMVYHNTLHYPMGYADRGRDSAFVKKDGAVLLKMTPN